MIYRYFDEKLQESLLIKRTHRASDEGILEDTEKCKSLNVHRILRKTTPQKEN